MTRYRLGSSLLHIRNLISLWFFSKKTTTNRIRRPALLISCAWNPPLPTSHPSPPLFTKTLNNNKKNSVTCATLETQLFLQCPVTNNSKKDSYSQLSVHCFRLSPHRTSSVASFPPPSADRIWGGSVSATAFSLISFSSCKSSILLPTIEWTTSVFHTLITYASNRTKGCKKNCRLKISFFILLLCFALNASTCTFAQREIVVLEQQEIITRKSKQSWWSAVFQASCKRKKMQWR